MARDIGKKAVVGRRHQLNTKSVKAFRIPRRCELKSPPRFDRFIAAAANENDAGFSAHVEGGFDFGAGLVAQAPVAAAVELVERQGHGGNIEQAPARRLGWKISGIYEGKSGGRRRRTRDIVEIKAIDFAVAINIGLEVARANIVAGRRFAATIAQAIVVELLLMNAAASLAVGALNAAERQKVCKSGSSQRRRSRRRFAPPVFGSGLG